MTATSSALSGRNGRLTDPSPRVLCIGVATHDTIVDTGRYPAPDDRVIVEEISEAGGGPAATAAVTLARLGVTAGLLAIVGDDVEGDAVRRGLADEGVDVHGVATVDGMRTARSVVIVSREGDTRAILTRPSEADPQGSATVPPAHWAERVRSTTAWVHLDHAGWAHRAALGIVRGIGPLISLDAGYPMAGLDPAAVDLFAPTAAVVAHLRPDLPLAAAVGAIAAEAGTIVVATDGARGVIASDGQRIITVPAFHVRVRSTLGAGDVFHGALVAGLADGYGLLDAVTRAAAAAALSCTGLDGRSAIPTTEVLAAYLATGSTAGAGSMTGSTGAPTERHDDRQRRG